jgi:hypothetical protein
VPEITVYIARNPLQPELLEEHHCSALVPWLVERYGTWPKTARLCHRWGSFEGDVTPATPADVAALEDLPGPFVVRERPAGVVGSAISLGAQAIRTVLFGATPRPGHTQRQQRTSKGSPNVTLSDRSNKARPEERIPDMYGTGRSIPDVLMQPYSVYVDHRQQEIGYYCVTRGPASVVALRDGPQLIGDIEAASAQVYGPGNAPTGGPLFHTPDTTVGAPIDDDVYTVYRVAAVNGQELVAPFHDFTFYMTRFSSDPALADGPPIPGFVTYVGGAVGMIKLPYSTEPEEITDRVAVGDQLFVFWPMNLLPAGTGTAPDLNTPLTSTHPLAGAFLTVTAVDSDNSRVNLTVNIPAGQQAQWALLSTYFGVANVSFFPAQVTNISRAYVGPLFVDFQHPPGFGNFQILCNFVAPQGSYLDDGTTARSLDPPIIVLVTPADSSGSPIGATQIFEQALEGSAVIRGQRALTMRIAPTGMGATTYFLIRAYLASSVRRERQHDSVEVALYGADLSNPSKPRYTYYSGRVVSEVRWVDCYSMSTPPNISFGNVTTVHTRTIATDGAVRVRDRQLNCVATRKIQTWNGVSFGGPLLTSGFAQDMLFSILKDPNIGNLPDSAIDFPGIAAAFDEVRAKVFDSSPLATAFSHTFDDPDLSLEETIQILCQACFAHAYRDGSVIRVRPDVAHDDSVLVLNHRNVVRGSQRITHTFGAPTENDSIECVYLDPNTGQSEKVSVPIGTTHLRPRQLNVVGLRFAKQAYWHAYRAYFRMLYQRQSLTLEAAQEAGLLRVLDRVLVADLTRSSGVQDGEVLFAGGASLTTSQRVALAPGKAYTLYLQAPDGTVQERAVSSSGNDFQLTLASPPSPAPITDAAAGVRTLYFLVADDQPAPRAFLVTGTSGSAELTHEVNAINYSHLYYMADGLQGWVIFDSLIDLSPYQHAFTNHGGIISGGVWTGSGASYFKDDVDNSPNPSYTKMLRIHPTVAGGSELITSGIDFSELFSIENPGGIPTLIGGHNGVQSVSAPISLAADHAVVLTYDSVTQRMALFIDGALKAQASSVAPSAGTGQTTFLQNFDGTCRSVLIWGRALSDREVEELFLRGV